MKKERIILLDLLKIIAILLVFNSHCDSLYKNSIYATGGALGNALFFIISGYLLSINEPFKKWIFKKLKRIYIPVIIVTTISCIIQLSFPKTIVEFIKTYIWPTNYWFVGALAIFYILIFAMNKYNLIKDFKNVSFITVIVYFLYYLLLIDKSVWSVETPGLLSISGLFKLIYYFYIFFIGYYIKQKDNNYHEGKKYGILIVITVIIYFAFKYLLQRGIVNMELQFITQLIGILFSILCLYFAIKNNNCYIKSISYKVANAIKMFSNISFEVYLLQFIVIKACISIPFPINIIMALIITVIMALVLKKVEEILLESNRRR